MWAADLKAIFVGGGTGSGDQGSALAYRSEDDGLHWQLEDITAFKPSAVSALWGDPDGRTIFAGLETGKQKFWKSGDGGLHWQAGGPDAMMDMAGGWADLYGAPSVLYGAGDIPATVVFSRDNGQTWSATPTAPPTNLDLYSIWVADSGRIWVGAGGNGNLFSSDDEGKSWTWVATGQPRMLHLRAWGYAHDLYAGGEFGFIAHSSDEGMNWTVQASGVTDEIRRIWGSSASDVYAVTLKGNILHTTNRGGQWKTEVPATDPDLTLWNIFGVDGEVFAVGERGAGFGKEGFDGVIYHRY